MAFVYWARKVLSKWIWLLGFVPLLLDYLVVYIPTNYLPEIVRKLIREGANWQLTSGLVVLGLLLSAFLVHEETKKELKTKIAKLEKDNEKFLSDSISENSIVLSHFSTSGYNAIELRYVMGNEPISVSFLTLIYFDNNGEKKVQQISQYFALSDNLLAGHSVNLNVLNVGEGVRFHTLSRDDVKNESVTISMGFTGLKSGKQVEFERQIPMKPNQVWLIG
jgi:hypothetical protein